MLKNYLISAWRALWKHRLSSAVNLLLLAVALAYALLALTYVRQELTYDAFHQKAGQIYQVHASYPGHPRFSLIPPDADIGPALVQWHPSIHTAIRIRKQLMDVGFTAETYDEFVPVAFADPELLELFDFPLVAGNADSALSAPNTLLLTETAANHYFPNGKPLGQALKIFVRRYDLSGFHRYTLEPHRFIVAGVLRDPPPNSSLAFDLLLPYAAAKPLNVHGIRGLYIELAPGVDGEAVEVALPQFVSEKIGKKPSDFALNLQPLLSTHFDERIEYDHLGNSPAGRPKHLYILAGMAFLVLAVASLAYANLSTAHSLSRVREVGIRKTIGATPRQLWLQFWGESLLTSLLSLAVGIGLAWIASDFFGELVDRRLDLFGNLPGDLVWFLGLALLTGLAAGGYPALILARAEPISIVRGLPTGRGRRSFSRAMMVLQFGLAVFLVVCVAVMGAQFLYLQKKDLGFDADHVLGIPLGNQHPDVVTVFRKELENAEGVVALSGSDQAPAMSYISATWKRDPGNIDFDGFRIEQKFPHTMGLRLLAGRWLDPEQDRSPGAVVVNETFVRTLGWSDPIGRQLPELPKPGRFEKWSPTIVGIVHDFHNRDVQRTIKPAVLELQDRNRGYKYLVVRLSPGKVESGVAAVRQTWRKVTGGAPFHPRFPDQLLDDRNVDIGRWTHLIRWSALLTLLIAGLSVFGLAGLEARRRTREIGIRKILGASIPRIVHLLLRDFSGWVLLANLLAWPAAYLAMKLWLANFPYHIALGPRYFLLAGFVGLAIAAPTAAWHAVRAGLANPVDTLRQE